MSYTTGGIFLEGGRIQMPDLPFFVFGASLLWVFENSCVSCWDLRDDERRNYPHIQAGGSSLWNLIYSASPHNNCIVALRSWGSCSDIEPPYLPLWPWTLLCLSKPFFLPLSIPACSNHARIRRVVYSRQTRSNLRSWHYTLIGYITRLWSFAHFQQQIFSSSCLVQQSIMQFLAEIFLALEMTRFPKGDNNIHFSAQIYGGKKLGRSKLRVEVSWMGGISPPFFNSVLFLCRVVGRGFFIELNHQLEVAPTWTPPPSIRRGWNESVSIFGNVFRYQSSSPFW